MISMFDALLHRREGEHDAVLAHRRFFPARFWIAARSVTPRPSRAIFKRLRLAFPGGGAT